MAKEPLSRKRGRINILDEADISRWCKLLQCEREDLVQAVLVIGDSPKMVDDYLYLNRKKRISR